MLISQSFRVFSSPSLSLGMRLGMCLGMCLGICLGAQSVQAQDIRDTQDDIQETQEIQETQDAPVSSFWVLDGRYWPLSTSLFLSGGLVGAGTGLAANRWEALVLRGSFGPEGDIFPFYNGLGPDMGLGILAGAGTAILISPFLQGWVAAPNPDEPDQPLDPAYAAAIGSGIFWGSIYGMEVSSSINAVVRPAILGTPVPILAGAVAGGLLMATLPAPENTAQVGMRNVFGGVAFMTGATLFQGGSCGYLCNGAAFQAPIALLQSGGLWLGDYLSTVGHFTDNEVALLTISAMGGFVAGYVTGTTFMGLNGTTASVFASVTMLTATGGMAWAVSGEE